MKYVPIPKLFISLVFFSVAAAFTQADLVIPTVMVGDPGNDPDPLNSWSVPSIGSVDYTYYIGIYEVTNEQYAMFLNAVAATDVHGLYNAEMANTYGGITRSGSSGSYTYTATRPNAPVNYVSFWDATRFVNWLTTGHTETGVYNLTADGIANNTITRDATAWANGGVAIASENEWYKAAYYSGSPTGADGDGYWLYPTQSNTITTANANYANFDGNVTDVGTYSDDASHYGTFDQAGNVWELIDKILSISSRGVWGESFLSSSISFSLFSQHPLTLEGRNAGFRISSLAPIQVTPFPPILPTFAEVTEPNLGETVILDATAISGYPAPTYQWYYNDFPLSAVVGGNQPILSFTATLDPPIDGVYRCVATNSEGTDEVETALAVFVDDDLDGLSNYREENILLTDPQKWDSDGDGLSDSQEVEIYLTDPNLIDTDEDGFTDKFEIETGFDPLLKENKPDAFSEALSAVEFSFYAELGLLYKIEVSEQLDTWTIIESGIEGNGGRIDRLYSMREQQKLFFRATKETTP